MADVRRLFSAHDREGHGEISVKVVPHILENLGLAIPPTKVPKANLGTSNCV